MDLIEERVRRLLQTPKGEREERFRELAPGDQLAAVLFAPWEQRHELILLAEDVKGLVGSIPPEELFWTLKAAGTENAITLIPYVSMEQLQFILDLDLWDRDSIRPEKVVAWLLLMMEADPFLLETWAQWLRPRDESLLPAMLRPFLQVVKRPDDMDLQEAQDLLPPFTIDNNYYIGFREEKLVPLFTAVLNRLAAHPGIYRDTLETILEETSLQTMEQAYRWRTARLSDWGIPDYYDSLEILAPPPGGRVRRWDSERGLERTSHLYQELIQPFVPTLYLGSTPQVAAGIMGVSGTMAMEEILWQWTAAANKLIVVERIDLDDPDQLRLGLLHASALLNIGIEMEQERSGEAPETILRTRVVEDLIRLANGEVMGIKKRVDSLIRNGLLPADLWPLCDRWREGVEGICWNETRLPVQLEQAPNLEKLRELQGLVREVEAWARLFQRLHPHWSRWEAMFPWSRLNIQEYTELTWPRALLTAMLHHHLSGEAGIEPIPNSQLPRARDGLKALEHSSQGFGPIREILGEEMAAPVIDHLLSLVRQVREEMEGVAAGELDGRFIPYFLIDLEG